ncbi:MAG: hypothetical protein H7Y36_05920 [Armatimonadetes bacterium]|nr:hypothetical protein [Akkermansiaceae bacterium]
MKNQTSDPGSSLPLVVSVGFAGSRMLIASGHVLTDSEREEFHQVVENYLYECIAGIPEELHLQPNHFLCGISQIAIGADTLFTRALSARGIPQRIFLPQAREEYLNATGTSGTPDFSTTDKVIASDLLLSPHIIQERVVSDASDRTNRFEDTNLHILNASDVIVILLRANADTKPGGTDDLLQHALHHHKPVLEIQVSFENQQAAFTKTWHKLPQNWIPAPLPEILRSVAFPPDPSPPPAGLPTSSAHFLSTLKSLGSQIADWKSKGFKNSALIIIGAHFIATICAVCALRYHHPAILIIELLLLITGFTVHILLHRSQSMRVWAVSRISAEIARSVRCIEGIHIHLGHLFQLPLPHSFRPLLRTINTLHLASSKNSRTSWQLQKNHYIENRLLGKDGQINYYKSNLEKATRLLKFANTGFKLATIIAVVATIVKLALIILNNHDTHLQENLGSIAILLPIAAVASLSLAASFDLEARTHTYDETLRFLLEVEPRLRTTRTERAFIRLLIETETRLLGETANWFSRRSFTGIN